MGASLLKMPPKFWSKISIKSQDSRFDVVEATQERVVPAMVEQRNYFSNKFYDFRALIEEMINQSLMTTRCFEERMATQTKAIYGQVRAMAKETKALAKQAKVMMEE